METTGITTATMDISKEADCVIARQGIEWCSLQSTHSIHHWMQGTAQMKKYTDEQLMQCAHEVKAKIHLHLKNKRGGELNAFSYDHDYHNHGV